MRDVPIVVDRPRKPNMTADTERVDVDPVASTRPPAAGCPTTDREYEFCNAPASGDGATVYALIGDGADSNPSTCANNNALHHATWMGHRPPPGYFSRPAPIRELASVRSENPNNRSRPPCLR